ncbi:hypothetical protein D3C71_2131110 [compost metagenome]
MHPGAGADITELQLACSCQHGEFLRQRIEHVRQRERARIGDQPADFQSRNIEQARQ